MMQLLIVGGAILAQGPFEQVGEAIRNADSIWPTHVIDGYRLIETEVPDGFVPADYIWTGDAVELKPETPADADELAALKAAKNEEINRWRDEANGSTFPHLGKHFAVDGLSFRDIASTAGYIGLFGAFHPDFPGGWKASDNTYLPMPTVEDFKAFYAAMVDQGTGNFNHAQALKAALGEATSATQVAAIAW